ncbi:MAG TPA: aspartyl protease family protein [Stellaceae bacterium]|nr:aspartyl protease family protein [Stellaceae bacterium]
MRLSRSIADVMIASLAGALCPPAVAAAEDCALKLFASVPASLDDGELTVPVAIDGLPTRMVVDTGSSVSTIDAGLAGALELPARPSRIRMTGVDGTYDARVVRVGELRLGRGIARDGDFVVQPSAVGTRVRGFSGLFGADFLAGYEVELDLAEGKLNLFLPDHCRGRVVYWDSGYYEMPMDVSRDLHIAIETRVNGTKVKAALDTGATTTALMKRAAKSRLDLSDDDFAKDPEGHAVGVAGRGAVSHLHRFDTVELDGVTLKNWAVNVIDAPGGDARWGGADMLIGLDVITRFRMLISYKEEKIYFTPATAKPPAPASAEGAAKAALARPEERQVGAAGAMRLGEMYETGSGVAADPVEAMKWYRKAADAGDAAGERAIGMLYQAGKGVPVDDVQAMIWLRKAADAGDAIAPNQIGYLYETGGGVAIDYSQAMTWYGRAAAKGNATAETNIGNLYHLGRGVPVDDAQAASWYRKAADAGYPAGQFQLARLYATGMGIAKDCAEARRWFQKASDSGNLAARTWLAGNKDCG